MAKVRRVNVEGSAFQHNQMNDLVQSKKNDSAIEAFLLFFFKYGHTSEVEIIIKPELTSLYIIR